MKKVGKKKLIEYYGVKIEVSLYHHSNYPAYTFPDEFLLNVIRGKRFKTKSEAEEYVKSLKL